MFAPPQDSIRKVHRDRLVFAVVQHIGERRIASPDLSQIATAANIPLEKVKVHFPDGRALQHAAAKDALILLIETCTRVVVDADPRDPMAQFGAFADAFLEWANSNQEQFRIISDEIPLEVEDDIPLSRYLDSIHEVLVKLLIRARDQGQLHPQDDVQKLALTSISFAYGLARMVVDGRLIAWAPGIEPLEMSKILARDYLKRVARSSKADSD